MPISYYEQSETNYIVSGPGDLLIGWSINNSIIHCANEFSSLSWCGTYLEIHRPLNKYVIESQKIEKTYSENISFLYLSTKKLCAGSYEVLFFEHCILHKDTEFIFFFINNHRFGLFLEQELVIFCNSSSPFF